MLYFSDQENVNILGIYIFPNFYSRFRCFQHASFFCRIGKWAGVSLSAILTTFKWTVGRDGFVFEQNLYNVCWAPVTYFSCFYPKFSFVCNYVAKIENFK